MPNVTDTELFAKDPQAIKLAADEMKDLELANLRVQNSTLQRALIQKEFDRLTSDLTTQQAELKAIIAGLNAKYGVQIGTKDNVQNDGTIVRGQG